MKSEAGVTYVETNVVCTCGNAFKVMSNNKELQLEVCNKCHPFYIGSKDGLGTSKAGRVEKFNRKYGLSTDKKEA